MISSRKKRTLIQQNPGTTQQENIKNIQINTNHTAIGKLYRQTSIRQYTHRILKRKLSKKQREIVYESCEV